MTGQDGAGSMGGADGVPPRDELRQLVREVLREFLPVVPPAVLAAALPAVPPAVLAAALPAAAPAVPPAVPSPAAHKPGSGRPDGAARPVRLATEEELHAFVVEVLRLADDPQRRIDLLAGRIRFTPAQPSAGRGNAPSAATPPALRQARPPGPAQPSAGRGNAPSAATPPALRQAPPPGPARPAEPAAGSGQDDGAVRRVEKGAVTERAVIAAARAGDRLVLGPRAVLTPLARDKARALGVPVEKER